jgi:predicted ester cyclase
MGHEPTEARRPTVSAQANKATVRRWFGEIVNGQTDRTMLLRELDETFAPEFLDHDGPDPSHGREALRKMLPLLLAALPDARLTIEQLVAEGDLVAVRLRGEATHTAELAGVPPTGQKLVWTENELLRLRDGRIVESWGEGTLEDALATIGFHFGQRNASVPSTGRVPD